LTVQRVSLRVSPEAALRVQAARQASFARLLSDEPLLVLGNLRVPPLISEPITPGPASCFGPRGVYLWGEDGPLWICDTGHHRLLGFKSLPQTDGCSADWQIGQKDFSCEGRNGKGPIGPNTVNVPTGICSYRAGMAVADAWNHRILIWNSVPVSDNVPADMVLGQDSFAKGAANRGSDEPDCNTLYWPYGVCAYGDTLVVADTGNRRVLIWTDPLRENGQSANCVLGQEGFRCRNENAGFTPSAMSMRWPHAVCFWGNDLCVSDAGNNRILVFDGCPNENGAGSKFILGQTDAEKVDFNQALYWPRANTLNMPYGVTAFGDWLIVADTANSRLLGWNRNQMNRDLDALALFGQSDFHEKGDNRWQPAVADSVCWPYAVQVSGAKLLIADSGNNRVSVWNLLVTPMPAGDEKAVEAWRIRVTGTVQGVGFRPTVFKLAHREGIKGHVLNDGEGVLVEAWGSKPQLERFMECIKTEAPPLARIENVDFEIFESESRPCDFVITKSESNRAKTNISPDAATCGACGEDTMSPFNRRFRYPFTNCTHCGPRLSIIRSIPYDRVQTSMASFTMCEQCRREYDDPGDRRFHAQPNACHVCGPRAWLERSDGAAICIESLSQLDDVDAATTLIQRGEIVAIKGVGGFHLACDATNEEAVARLRFRKHRYHKPFALMAKDLEMIGRYCLTNDQERQELTSTVAPIVVLRINSELPDKVRPIAPSVAPAQKTLGFMLPYTPLHQLLFKRLKQPIVLTSGNRVHEPQVISNSEAKSRLGDIADYFLLHSRDIINRLDDSVVQIACGKPAYLRRARGVSPAPIPLPPGFQSTPEILAMGAELKSTFCLTKDAKAIISQHIGDLEDARTFADYQHNLALYQSCFQSKPQRIVVDMHPDYLSTKLGQQMATEQSLPVDSVQHHHAHIASCLADNAWPLGAGSVLGIALDGLGYGLDGTFWGGEFLLADYTKFERLASFKPVAMLGGAQSIREPWRNTYAHILAEMKWPRYKMDFGQLELTSFFESKPLQTFNSMLASNTNSPLASSCGRLFDAVAAAIGICREQATYEGQAACELEQLVDMDTIEYESDELGYPFTIPRLFGTGMPYVEPLSAWQAILGDLILDTDRGVMAARFHKGLAKVIVEMVKRLCIKDGEKWLKTVALSGGVFQNKILLELVSRRLRTEDFSVLTHSRVPANDGGISLGQAVISAARLTQ
jgi:hydrogenase maturation protein HypF